MLPVEHSENKYKHRIEQTFYLHAPSGKQVSSMSPGLNCESLDRVKLLRLKYLFLQTNKYLSQFLKWSVSMFSVMDALICEYTDVI